MRPGECFDRDLSNFVKNHLDSIYVHGEGDENLDLEERAVMVLEGRLKLSTRAHDAFPSLGPIFQSTDHRFFGRGFQLLR